MRLTTNLGLKKPEGTDVVNIDDFNYNADILDAKVKEISNKLSSISTNAKSTSFDNSSNGMSATNVQDAIVENKTSILSLENEFSITENTSYTTANGIKEFECKDGYVDNVAIEGQTKILNAENQECEAGANGAKLVSVGQGDKIEVLTKNSDETKQDNKQISTTLRSLPNGVKDTIEKRGNKYYKIKRCGEVMFNGTESDIAYTNCGTTGLYCYARIGLPKMKCSRINYYCDNFPIVNASSFDIEGVFGEAEPNVGKYFYIMILKSKLSTQDEEGFKSWLKENPVTVVYELETPIITELPNFNPQTFSDKTTLLLNSGAVQAEANFEVTNSLGSELEVLKGKVSDLDDYESGYEYSNNITYLNGSYKPSWAEQPYIVRVGKICILHCIVANDACEYGLPLIKLPSFAIPKQLHRYSGRGKCSDSATLLLVDYNIEANDVLKVYTTSGVATKLNELYVHTMWEVE